ncbi:YopX protein [compost metagenome]
MMRPIKFRAWHKIENRMIEPVIELDFTKGYERIRWYETMDDAMSGCISDESMDNVELMQYTGLNDKNGKEIYERDIVKHKHAFSGGFGQVKYIVPCFGLRSLYEPSVSTDFEWTDFEEFEVIGNVHENTEMYLMK